MDLDTPAEVLFNNHAEWEYKSNFLVFRSFGPLAGPARLPGIGADAGLPSVIHAAENHRHATKAATYYD